MPIEGDLSRLQKAGSVAPSGRMAHPWPDVGCVCMLSVEMWSRGEESALFASEMENVCLTLRCKVGKGRTCSFYDYICFNKSAEEVGTEGGATFANVS